MKLPTPHLEKLLATLENDKLPSRDKSHLEACIGKYQEWITKLLAVSGTSLEDVVDKMVALLNEYRLYLDVEVIFDREDDFL